MAQQTRHPMTRGSGWQQAGTAGLVLDEARLNEFCERWRVSCLELFGSILREDFRPDSDVDVLVTFEPDADWGLFDHAAMGEELADVLGRSVDLLTRRAVERSVNPLRRSTILADAMPLLVRLRSSGDSERVDA